MMTKRPMTRKPKSIYLPCIQCKQGNTSLYITRLRASVLYELVKINRRIEGKDEGYQRVLSPSRVQAIKKHILSKRCIPGSIILTFENATFDKDTSFLIIPTGNDQGWVIDGQHRLSGAYVASQEGTDIELPLVAFIGLDIDNQIEQFITINREAKGVPTSLYLDLLGKLSNKTEADMAKERAADIATIMKRDENSPLYQRVVAMRSPKIGEISTANFVRKVQPLITEGKGIFAPYTEQEQLGIISNYFITIRNVFPDEFNKRDSVFFKTVGFGALINTLPQFFTFCLKETGGFAVQDATKLMSVNEDFDFASWKAIGTGSKAEKQAGDDFWASIQLKHASYGSPSSLRLE